MNNLVLKYDFSLKARKFLDDELWLYFPKSIRVSYLYECFPEHLMPYFSVYNVFPAFTISALSRHRYCSSKECGDKKCYICIGKKVHTFNSEEEFNLFVKYLKEII